MFLWIIYCAGEFCTIIYALFSQNAHLGEDGLPKNLIILLLFAQSCRSEPKILEETPLSVEGNLEEIS